jgi:acetyl/propionyl-CoA carboxylase alpha subunit
MRYRFQAHKQLYDIKLDRQGDNYLAEINGEPISFQILDSSPGQLHLDFSGRPVALYWAEEGGNIWVSYQGCTFLLERPLPGRRPGAGDGSLENTVRSPMPAQVRALYVAEGEAVQKGDTLLLLEAMKMEIKVQAPRAGVIQRILVSTGETVNREQELVWLGD